MVPLVRRRGESLSEEACNIHSRFSINVKNVLNQNSVNLNEVDIIKLTFSWIDINVVLS